MKTEIKTLKHVKSVAEFYSDDSTKTHLYRWICERIKELQSLPIQGETVTDEQKQKLMDAFERMNEQPLEFVPVITPEREAELLKRVDELEDIINKLSDEKFAYEKANKINTTEKDKLRFEFKELHVEFNDGNNKYVLCDPYFVFDWFYAILHKREAELLREIEELERESGIVFSNNASLQDANKILNERIKGLQSQLSEKDKEIDELIRKYNCMQDNLGEAMNGCFKRNDTIDSLTEALDRSNFLLTCLHNAGGLGFERHTQLRNTINRNNEILSTDNKKIKKHD